MKRSKSFDPTEHAAEWRRLVERAKELLDSGKEPLDAIQWQESADALFAESDLGCLLIGTAMLTDVLEEKIRKKLLNLTGNTIPGRRLRFSFSILRMVQLGHLACELLCHTRCWE